MNSLIRTQKDENFYISFFLCHKPIYSNELHNNRMGAWNYDNKKRCWGSMKRGVREIGKK